MSEIIDQYYDAYVEYFRNMAINHARLKHEDETKKKAFVRVSIQEAFLGYDRNALRKDGLVMELIDPTIRLGKSSGEMKYKNLQGGFQILGHHKNADDSSQTKVMAIAEETANDILLLMSLHSRGGHPLFCRSFDNGENVDYNFVTNGRDGNYAGVRLMFDFKNARSTCVKQSAWCNDLEADEFIQLDDLKCIQ